MFKRIVLIMCLGMFIFGINKISYAMSCHEGAGQDAQTQATQNTQVMQMNSSEHSSMTHIALVSQEAVNVGNKICPVTGEKIEEKAKMAYEYKGKIYNLCCSACVEEFKKNPDKYIQIVNEELKNNK